MELFTEEELEGIKQGGLFMPGTVDRLVEHARELIRLKLFQVDLEKYNAQPGATGGMAKKVRESAFGFATTIYELEDLAKKYEDDGYEVVGVTQGNNDDFLLRFCKP